MLNKSNNMLRRLSTSKSLSIELLEPIVYIGSNMDAPPVLRGTVVVAVSKPHKVRSLVLQFEGSLKTKYLKESKSFKSQKTIAHTELVLHSANNDEIELNAGSTRFAFEMPLPARIPETIHCSQISVDYRLMVDMNYNKKQVLLPTTSNQHEESIAKDVIVVRLPDAGILSSESYPIIDSHKHFSKWFQYRITVIDKKSLALGSRIPIKVEIMPVVKDLKFKQIAVQLLETRTIQDEQDGTKSKNQLFHFINPIKGQKFKLPKTSMTSGWEDVCEYQIPDNGSIVHSTEKNYPGFHVGHVLLISFIFVAPNKGTRNITFQTEIDILDSHVSDTQDDCKLPAYDFPVSNDEFLKLSRYGLVTPPSYESLAAI